MASVTLSSLRKAYAGNQEVVKGIDLDIKDGEFMVLVGPSGCGKSTTLRMIAGLEDISGGEILINGVRVNELAPKDRNIAMVFQNYALYPHMNVYENIAFGLRLMGMQQDQIDARIHEVAEMLEISYLLGRKPRDMSGGQRQRVALGRAIARKAQVYLFDEPLSNLDARLRSAMRVRLARLHQDLKAQGLPHTMIYVTHDQAEAMTLGHRICVMESGEIRQTDSPLSLYQSPVNKFAAEFIGSPSMNFIKAELIQKNSAYYLDIGAAQLPLSKEKTSKAAPYLGKSLALGIRAEHISCSRTPVEGSFLSQIQVVEPLGNEDLLYFPVGGNLFVMSLRASRDNPHRGESCSISFNTEYIHLFDMNTEKNIMLN